MKYEIIITGRVEKQLKRIDNKDRERIYQKIKTLSDDPRPRDSKKLTNREGWRVRVGKYRILYDINDNRLTVVVVEVGHRREVYR